MDSHYSAQDHEEQIYQLWQEHQAFNPDALVNNSRSSEDSAGSDNPSAKTSSGRKKPFCIIMPPPNANDPLHIGHAMFVSLEDVMVRWHRMLGDDTLWLPGTDHAGIETQFVFEKKLKKEGKSRFHFDRTTLYQMIWDYVRENSQTAVQQMQKLGASADWSRLKFTLDPDIVQTVLATFQHMQEDGLIYRDNRLVNYCSKCGTAFSNLEIKHQTQTTDLYYIKYGPFVLATTRPETKFADTAVAVHPKDKRYQQYIGQEIEVEGLTGQFKLKVIADEFVDPEFGSGVVKITPYHDFNDFAAWQRHAKEMPAPKQVIDFNGRLTEVAGPYAGLKVAVAREQVVKDLEAKGLLVKVDHDYQNNIAICYRCSSVIEPLPLPQVYVKVKPLTEPVLQQLKEKKIKIYGAGHDKILRHWLEQLEDWNISRQIVWGIRLPLWYNYRQHPQIQVTFLTASGDKQSGRIGELLEQGVAIETIKQGLQNLSAPIEAEYLLSLTEPGPDFIQETDTFDTWFSSSQWPFVTLMNSQAGDFERFYPTAVMETGYDILPFWVMRMLMMGYYRTGQLPFKEVYLHGLIRDAQGRKMSKSKGNVINPAEISQKYGTDALRMALIIRSSAGLDKSVGEGDFKAARNLTNKLWNASRFILLRQEQAEITRENGSDDAAFRQKLQQLIQKVTQNLRRQQLGLAAETLHNEFWHWFCDLCIEDSKQGKISQAALLDGLSTFLKLFHPFLPFITEVIWQELKKMDLVKGKLLMTAAWPTAEK